MKRKKIVFDASGQIVGRLATQVAIALMGKNKTTFEKNIDGGDKVEIQHVSQIRFTGKKLVQKEYRHHSNHPGGLKSKLAKDVLKNNPQDILLHAVSKMLPRNKMRDERLKRVSFSD